MSIYAIKVINIKGITTSFELASDIKMSIFMKAYCRLFKLEKSNDVIFTLDGSKINESDTPKPLGMDKNVENLIDVFYRK